MASSQGDPSRNRPSTHAARPAAVDRLVVSLPHDPRAPARARRSLEPVATERQLDDEFNARLALIVTELVTNAVVYGTEPVTPTVSWQPGEVTVEVTDGDPRSESVRIREVDAPVRGRRPGGRGLTLVAAMADEWGLRRERSGKTVWARCTYAT